MLLLLLGRTEQQQLVEGGANGQFWQYTAGKSDGHGRNTDKSHSLTAVNCVCLTSKHR
jgi:hypothetical protein